MSGDDKVLAIFALSVFGAIGAMMTPWAIAGAIAGVVAVAFARGEE